MSHHNKGEGEGDKLDLLVFGYACKLFRDDERALFLDNGSHLIPWMGDDSLKIDRYDGRGALYDLNQYEPQPGAWENLPPEEEEEERKCDKERYRSLFIDDTEEVITQEEILKRAQVGQDFSQVAYSYNESAIDEITEGTQGDDGASSQPFTPPEGLSVPSDMVMPESMKQHAIIERTATFIAQQGSQMEILMKVKQNSNRLFDFLSFNDPLHNYYKHLLSNIKSGAYVPVSQDKNWSDEESEDHTDDDHYLHPSLASIATKPVVAPPPLTAPPPPQILPVPFETPPEIVQKIVEKMVAYVLKNGQAFEAAITKRKDSRFSFLEPKDPHNKYYKEQLAKREECIARTKINKNATAPPPPKEPSPPKVIKKVQEEAPVNKPSSKKRPTPVCFSIKKPKESEGLEVPSALPVEDSTDEEEGAATSPKPSPKPSSPTSELSEDSELVTSGSSSTKHKSSSSRSKRKRHSRHEKDSHLQKERKMKVAQFLKGIKNKS